MYVCILSPHRFFFSQILYLEEHERDNRKTNGTGSDSKQLIQSFDHCKKKREKKISAHDLPECIIKIHSSIKRINKDSSLGRNKKNGSWNEWRILNRPRTKSKVKNHRVCVCMCDNSEKNLEQMFGRDFVVFFRSIVMAAAKAAVSDQWKQ